MAKKELRHVEKASVALTEAKRDWRRALTLARASGESYVDIAAVAGVSDERVRQVVQEEAARDAELAALLPPSRLRSA